MWLAIALLFVTAVSGTTRPLTCADVKLVATATQKYYGTLTGTWDCGIQSQDAGEGWWQCANTFEALLNYMDYCNDTATFGWVIEDHWSKTEAGYLIKVLTETSMDDLGRAVVETRRGAHGD